MGKAGWISGSWGGVEGMSPSWVRMTKAAGAVHGSGRCPDLDWPKVGQGRSCTAKLKRVAPRPVQRAYSAIRACWPVAAGCRRVWRLERAASLSILILQSLPCQAAGELGCLILAVDAFGFNANRPDRSPTTSNTSI